MVDEFGTPKSFDRNVELEYARNGERYEFSSGAAERSTISRSSRRERASATR